jgi:hypothetical protein
VTEVLEATAHWAPWWAWLIVVLTCVAARTFAYVYAQRLRYQFAAKALDKVQRDQVAAVVEAIAGRGNGARLCPGMHRSARGEDEREASADNELQHELVPLGLRFEVSGFRALSKAPVRGRRCGSRGTSPRPGLVCIPWRQS